MIFCEELMSNGQTRSHFGPKVGFEEIAIHFLEARFWIVSGWPTIRRNLPDRELPFYSSGHSSSGKFSHASQFDRSLNNCDGNHGPQNQILTAKIELCILSIETCTATS